MLYLSLGKMWNAYMVSRIVNVSLKGFISLQINTSQESNSFAGGFDYISQKPFLICKTSMHHLPFSVALNREWLEVFNSILL